MSRKLINLFDYRAIENNLGRVVEVDSAEDQILLRGGIGIYEFGGKDDWITTRDWAFWSARLQKVVYIEAWRITDLASIPRVARVLVPKNERERIAALLHDKLYGPDGELCTRWEADLVLKDFCKLLKVNPVRTEAIFAAVVSFGWMSYRRKPIEECYAPIEHREFYLKAMAWGLPPLRLGAG